MNGRGRRVALLLDADAAQQADIGILEARRDGARLGRRRRKPERRLGGHRRALGDEEAHGMSLDDAVRDMRQAQDARQRRAPAFGTGIDEKCAPGNPFGQAAGRPGVKQAALMQQEHVGAALRLVEVGRAPNDGDAALGEFLHHAPQLAPRNRIDAHARLVEQQHKRRMNEGAGKPELLLHAAGKPAGETALKPFEIGEGKEAGKACPALGADDAAQIGIKLEIFAHGKVLVEAEALRHVGGERVDRGGLRPGRRGRRR